MEADKRKIDVVQVSLTYPKHHYVKELFYDQLTSTINSSHKKDILILMGDLNAKVGADNRNVEHVMGK